MISYDIVHVIFGLIYLRGDEIHRFFISREDCMVTRLRIVLGQSEYSALLKIAVEELRNPEDQARFLIRKQLQSCGLLEGNSLEYKSKPISEVNNDQQ